MRFATETLGAVASLALLTSCGVVSGERPSPPLSTVAAAPETVTDGPVILGSPFTENGVTYTPQDNPLYDDVGYAGVIAADRVGKSTENGETYNASSISAAHRTLPVPSYVEVTALDSGRTILVRVNDRGPVAKDNVIQLSQGAVEQLGLNSSAPAAVRVRRVNPPEQEKAVLRSGARATERIETPDQLLRVLRNKIAKPPVLTAAADDSAAVKPATPPAKTAKTTVPAKKAPAAKKESVSAKPAEPAKEKAKAPVTGGYIVQIAALSSRARADALAAKVGGSVSTLPNSGLFRVRLGPFASKSEADQKLASVQKNGYPTARLSRE